MSGVRLIGGAIEYRDGSEQEVLELLERAHDLRSGSDELAGHIRDWPTKYHFSPLRANLLRPIRFDAAMRVLDVGAGTGALARHVAETGAEVVALEGTLERAEAAALRCRGLGNVEVVCGALDAFEDAAGFDIVLCVGVLEHTAPAHEETLAALRRLTRPDGVLALAIENQLGLRYLLGYAEDHLLEPWAGVEGYVGPAGVRTFSRDRLRRTLDAAGFGHQRWLFPFPDYKLPTAVLSEDAYRGPDAARFVDQLVRWPCSAEASPALRVCDDRLAHGAFLDAGLGPDVANSFLVLGADAASTVERVVDTDVTAWFFSGDRLRPWRSTKVFRADAVTGRGGEGGDGERWLRQQRPATQDRFAGPTIEQRFLAACGEGREQAEAILRRWRDHLRASESPHRGEPDHPFLSRHTRTVFPADHLDLNLSNFVDVGGELVYVDAEWVAPPGVDAQLALLRAMWGLAADLVQRGVLHPWSPEATVDELALALGRAAEIGAGQPELDRWRLAEADLLSAVAGRSVEDHLEWLRGTGELRQAARPVRRMLPFTALRRRLALVEHRLGVVQDRLAASEAEGESLRRQLEDAHARLAASSSALEERRREVAALTGRLEATSRAHAAAEAVAAASARRAEHRGAR